MLRLLIDENFNHRILRGLKLCLPNLNYVLVREIGMSGFPDLELLRLAARENRIILTHDKKTMIPDAGFCLKIGEPMAGLIYVPRSMNVGAAIRDLQLMVECLSPDELKDQIKRLPL